MEQIPVEIMQRDICEHKFREIPQISLIRLSKVLETHARKISRSGGDGGTFLLIPYSQFLIPWNPYPSPLNLHSFHVELFSKVRLEIMIFHLTHLLLVFRCFIPVSTEMECAMEDNPV